MILSTTMNEVPSLFRRRSALTSRDPNILVPLSNPLGEVVDAMHQAENIKIQQAQQRKKQNTERHIQKACPGLAQAMRTLATPFDPKAQVTRMEKRLSEPPTAREQQHYSLPLYASTNDHSQTNSQASSRRSSTNTLKDLLEEKDRELHLKSRPTSAFISSGDASNASTDSSPPRTQRSTNDKSSLSAFKQSLRQMLHASQVARDDDLDAYVHASEEEDEAAEIAEKPELPKRKSTMYLDDLIQIEAELDKEFGPMDSTTATTGTYTRSQPASRQLSRRNSFTGTPFSIAASVPPSASTSPVITNESAGSLSRRSGLTTTLPPPTFSRRTSLPAATSEKVEQEHKQEEKTAATQPMRTLKDIMGGKFVPTRPTTARTASMPKQQQPQQQAVTASTTTDPKPASTITSRPASAYMRQTQSASMKNKKFLKEASNTPPRHHSNKKKSIASTTATIARVPDNAPVATRGRIARESIISSSDDDEEEMAEYLKPIPRMRPFPPTSASNSTSNSSSTASLVNSTSTSPRSTSFTTQPSSNESSVKSLLHGTENQQPQSSVDEQSSVVEDENKKPDAEAASVAADVARGGRQAKQQRRLHTFVRPSTASSTISTASNASPSKATIRSKSLKSGASSSSSSSTMLSPKKSSSHHVHTVSQQQSTTSLHSNATQSSAAASHASSSSSSSSTSSSRLSTAVSSSLKSGGYHSLIDDLVATEVNELSEHVKQLVRDYNKLHAMGDNKAEQIIAKNRELVQLVGSSEVESSQTSHLTSELQSKQEEFSSLQGEQDSLGVENESLAKAIREEERKTRLQEKSMQNARMLVTQLTTKISIHTKKGADAREEAKEVLQETTKLQELIQARQKRNADDLTTQKQHVETLEMLRRARERQKQLEQQVQSETMEQLQQATISPSSAASSNSDRNSDPSPHEPRNNDDGDDQSESPSAVAAFSATMDPAHRHALNVWRSRMQFLHSETGLDDFLAFSAQMEKQPQQREEAEEQKQQLQMRLAEKQKEQRALAQLFGMNRLAMQKRSAAASAVRPETQVASNGSSIPSLDDLSEIIRRFTSVVQRLAVAQKVPQSNGRLGEGTDDFTQVSRLAAVVDSLHE